MMRSFEACNSLTVMYRNVGEKIANNNNKLNMMLLNGFAQELPKY